MRGRRWPPGSDPERSTTENVEAILEGMAWLGLDADEGPYFQTQRFARYREVIEAWLEDGRAYHCYCSKEELADWSLDVLAKLEFTDQEVEEANTWACGTMSATSL